MSAILMLALILSVSCKDHKMFGTVEVFVDVKNLPSQTGAYTAGLFDPSAYTDYSDALYETSLIAGKAEFKDVNPGNYIVVIEFVNGFYHGVQVRAGKTVSVKVN